MKKAAFLDRDGVINEDVSRLKSVADLRILPGVAQAIKTLHDHGYYVFVVTNQGAIAKGSLTHETLGAIHGEISARLMVEGAYIDKFYYCPHHPEGTVAEYSIACDCRKPNAGMLKRAIEEFEVDVEDSFLVGDKLSDILAGKTMGLRTALIKGTEDVNDITYEIVPDFTADDLLNAISYFITYP